MFLIGTTAVTILCDFDSHPSPRTSRCSLEDREEFLTRQGDETLRRFSSPGGVGRDRHPGRINFQAYQTPRGTAGCEVALPERMAAR